MGPRGRPGRLEGVVVPLGGLVYVQVGGTLSTSRNRGFWELPGEGLGELPGEVLRELPGEGLGELPGEGLGELPVEGLGKGRFEPSRGDCGWFPGPDHTDSPQLLGFGRRDYWAGTSLSSTRNQGEQRRPGVHQFLFAFSAAGRGMKTRGG